MLHNFVSLYIPGTSNVNEVITQAEHERVVRHVVERFAAEFGGATVTPATGYWVSDAKGLVEDKVSIVTSYFDRDPATAWVIATALALEIKIALSQEAVTIQTNDGLEFV